METKLTRAGNGRQQRVLIIGAGFGGIAAAIELNGHGITDLTILEAGPGIGGTWLFNTYPGAACDVPSHLYSYSFAQRRDWKRLCPTQPEILDYIRSVARHNGIDAMTRTNTRVTALKWVEATREWAATTGSGEELRADAVVIATGQLHQPAFTPIPGIEAFGGRSFHSAEWDHGFDMRGKRVAVIGTGASAVQFLPEVAREAAEVVVFQRTGNWFMPRRNRTYPRAIALAIRWLPGLQAFRRAFIFNYGEALTAMIRHPRTIGLIGRLRSSLFMRWQLRGNAELQRKVWPRYTFGCKRVLFSSFYLPTLMRENVEVVTDPITEFTPKGIRTDDGRERPFDCIIHATGFRTNDFMFPMEITGKDGITLRETWAHGPHAHLGMTVPGFPSLFLMYGPNTNTSGGSIIVYLEAQAAYVRKALIALRARGDAALDVHREVETASDRQTQARFSSTAWVRCDSWYRDSEGRIVANWPGYMREYIAATNTFKPDEFEFIGRG